MPTPINLGLIGYLLENVMNSVKKIAMLMCIGLPAFVHAGEAIVKWHDFNDYRDVRATNQAKGSYHKQIASSIEKHAIKLAEQLPKGYKLNLEITDVDLAGDVSYRGANEIRVVKPIHFPQLTLNYSLMNETGKEIGKGNDIKLKDMSFMDKIKMGRDESFYYEKRLLTEWFGEEILPKIN
jgi:hypothetical protein